MAIEKKKEKNLHSSRNKVAGTQTETKNDVQTRYQQDFNRYQAQIEKTRQVFESAEVA